MKKLLLSIITIIAISTGSFAQAPEGFNYQAVVRNAGNVILSNQAVGMRLTIQQGSIGGTAVYSETFTPTTNAYGLVNLQIGTGVSVDDLAAINWSNGPYFMETAIDVTGGTSYVIMGTSQLMSVPYALHAKTAENVLNDQVNDADADPANEIQDISLSGSNLTISDGSTIDLSVINTPDADASPTNEIQNISLSGTNLTISDGATIDLSVINTPDADANPTNEIQDITLSGTNLTISDGSTIDLSVVDTQIDSLGIVALGFKAPVNYSTFEYQTGVKWLDGKVIYKRTWVKTGTEFPNWSLMSGSFYETVVDYECKIVGVNPTTATTIVNSPFVCLTTDDPLAAGWLVLSNINQSQVIKVGSTITVYYTKP